MASDQVPVSGGAATVHIYASDAVVFAEPDSTLRAVAEMLAAGSIGLVVLGATDDVRGVVSERDVVRALATGLDPSATRAEAVASRDVVWCDATATVHEVAEQMMEKYVRHVLLERDGHLVGIVSARDLLGAYAVAEDAEGG